jgi:hypothetical protein
MRGWSDTRRRAFDRLDMRRRAFDPLDTLDTRRRELLRLGAPRRSLRHSSAPGTSRASTVCVSNTSTSAGARMERCGEIKSFEARSSIG